MPVASVNVGVGREVCRPDMARLNGILEKIELFENGAADVQINAFLNRTLKKIKQSENRAADVQTNAFLNGILEIILQFENGRPLKASQVHIEMLHR